jgi:hypothetical protein
MLRRSFRRCFPLLLALWVLFVLYPNPVKLIVSIHRTYTFEAVPNAVQFMLSDLPPDPVGVERAVLTAIPYRYDWEVYGMPWYFPTIEEVLQRREGDCKARALVMASVFEALGIPYRINSSPTHIWVEYDGKVETSVENPQVQFYQRDPETGESKVQVPEISVNQVVHTGWRAFWNPMPDARKALLLSGLMALIIARVILHRKRAIQQDEPETAERPDATTRGRPIAAFE